LFIDGCYGMVVSTVINKGQTDRNLFIYYIYYIDYYSNNIMYYILLKSVVKNNSINNNVRIIDVWLLLFKL